MLRWRHHRNAITVLSRNLVCSKRTDETNETNETNETDEQPVIINSNYHRLFILVP